VGRKPGRTEGVRKIAARFGVAVGTVQRISRPFKRVRRLFGMLPRDTPALRDLQPEWTRVLPADAPLTALERWEQVFAHTPASDWPDGTDRSGTVLDILGILAKGPVIAAEAGETLLSGRLGVNVQVIDYTSIFPKS